MGPHITSNIGRRGPHRGGGGGHIAFTPANSHNYVEVGYLMSHMCLFSCNVETLGEEASDFMQTSSKARVSQLWLGVHSQNKFTG